MKKIAVLICSLLAMCFYGFGQTLLNVPNIVQKDGKWCWAASTEMIIKYHGDIRDQCSIVAKSFSTICTCPTTLDCSSTCSSSSCSGTATAGKLKGYLKDLGFTSKKVDNDLSWKDIKMQIDSGLPFMVGIGCSGGHLLTANGYRKMPTNEGGLQFILVNDPICCAGTSFVEIRSFDGTGNKPDESYCQFIYNIKQKTGYVKNLQFSTPINCPAIRNRIAETNLTSSIAPTNQIITVNMGSSTDRWVDIVNNIGCSYGYYYTRLKLINGFWEPVFVKIQNDDPNQLSVTTIEGRKLILSNNQKIKSGKFTRYVPYTKVVLKDSPYEVYAFKLSKSSKTTYFTPAHVDGDIQIGDALFKNGEVYRLKQIKDYVPNLTRASSQGVIKKPNTTLPIPRQPIGKEKSF
jgi:Peptidase_C39 like family